MSNRAKRAQQRVTEEKIEEMLLWYAANSEKPDLPVLCVDEKTYRGKVMRWLEPLLPGDDNPILIEEQLGDGWTLRFERIQPKIQA